MEPVQEERWTVNGLGEDDNSREPFREASSNLVREVLKHHLNQDAKILEIGSGLGYFVSLVPELQHNIQQTEQSFEIAKKNKELNPASNVLITNVYELPFSERAFGAAIGYSVFDILYDLHQALEEINRVLKPRGTIICFCDLHIEPDALVKEYISEDTIPFPFFEYDPDYYDYRKEMHGRHDLRGICIIKRDDVQKVRRNVWRGDMDWFDKYTQDPISVFKFPSVDGLLRLWQYIENSEVETQIVTSNEGFVTCLEENLIEIGYTIIESGKREGNFIHYTPFESRGNVLIKECGEVTRDNLPELPKNEELRISRQHVVVAKNLN